MLFCSGLQHNRRNSVWDIWKVLIKRLNTFSFIDDDGDDDDYDNNDDDDDNDDEQQWIARKPQVSNQPRKCEIVHVKDIFLWAWCSDSLMCKIIITSIGQNLSFFMYLFHARFLKWFKCTVTSLIYTDTDQLKGCGWWKMWKQTNLKAMPLLRYKWCDFQLPEWIVSIFQTRHENQTAPVNLSFSDGIQ